MSESFPIREGQILTGSLFSEPMRVETVRAEGSQAWIVGLVGLRSEQFRRVTASGRTNGLRTLLAAEQERGPDFFRLSNALIPLYPQGYEERRLLEAMLLAAPR